MHRSVVVSEIQCNLCDIPQISFLFHVTVRLEKSWGIFLSYVFLKAEGLLYKMKRKKKQYEPFVEDGISRQNERDGREREREREKERERMRRSLDVKEEQLVIILSERYLPQLCFRYLNFLKTKEQGSLNNKTIQL